MPRWPKSERKRIHCGYLGCKVRPSRGFMGMFCAQHARELERIKADFDLRKRKDYRIHGSAGTDREETE